MTIEHTVAKMFITNTGIAMMDSGGDEGRAWQRIRKACGIPLDAKKLTPAHLNKAVAYLSKQPEFYIDTFLEKKDDTGEWVPMADDDTISSTELSAYASTYHYMVNNLELDDLCHAFNRRPVPDWNSDAAYGVSESGERWLTDHGLTVSDTWNSYNGEQTLDAVLQGANLHTEGHESEFEFPGYLLLQVHGGADVRGGYTDAKLFKVGNYCDYFTSAPNIYMTIGDHEVSTSYNGYSLTDEDGNDVELKVSDIRKVMSEGA